MRITLILFICILFSVAVMAQDKRYNITGTVKSDSAVVADVVLTLRSLQDSTLISGSSTDHNGAFVLSVPAGSYLLQVNRLGYTSRVFNIDITAEQVLPTVFIQKDSRALKEVEVIAAKPFISRKLDKTIVDIEHSVYSKGENGFRLFNVVPGVQTDNLGAIVYRGRENIKVYIDNRRVQLTGTQLMNYLKSIPSDAIKSMEISAVPASEYDAENAGAILNITMKNSYKQGLTGTISSYYEQHRYPNFNHNILLNYGVGKFNFQLNYANATAHGFSDNTEEQYYKNTGLYSVQDERYQEKIRYNDIKVGADYHITDKQLIGADYQFTRNNVKAFSRAENISGQKKTDSFFLTDNNRKYMLDNQFVNVFYRNRLDSAGSRLDVGYNYVNYDNNINSAINSQFFYPDGTTLRPDQLLTLINPLRIRISTFNADLQQVWGKGGLLKAGAKYTDSKTDNSITYYNFDKVDSNRSNLFDYREKIFALYGSYSRDIGDWSVNAGLRAEYTDYTGNSANKGTLVGRKLWSFFPSGFLQRKFGNDHTLNFSYSRRITRPSFQWLNPFEDVEDPYFLSRGNPRLVPYYTHSFEASYLLLSKYTFTAFYKRTNNIINNIYQTEGRQVISTYDNINDESNLGFSVNLPVQITKWWELTAYASITKNNIAVNESPIREYEKWTTYVWGSSRFTLPKGFFLELSGNYIVNAFYGIYDLRPQGVINLSIKKSVLKDHLTFTFNANDPFDLKRIGIDIKDPGFDRYITNVLPVRSLSIGVSYNFSKGRRSAQRENVDAANKDEINRLNK